MSTKHLLGFTAHAISLANVNNIAGYSLLIVNMCFHHEQNGVHVFAST